VKLVHFAVAAALFVVCSGGASANPIGEDAELFEQLKAMDAQVFDRGFNDCDIEAMSDATDDDFEFYHDQGGVTPNKAAFIESVENGICKLDYKPRRELVPGSLVVYPLYKDGVLYGAVQSGEHRFYAVVEGAPDKLTSTAQFTTLWLIVDGKWKMHRVLSFDHIPAE